MGVGVDYIDGPRRAVIMIAQDWKGECGTYEYTEEEGT